MAKLDDEPNTYVSSEDTEDGAVVDADRGLGGAPREISLATGAGPATGTGSWASTHEVGDRYQFLSKLGSGGMADVYLGMQRGEASVSRFVVIKKIHSRQMQNEAAHGMFVDEARTIATLNHPHIVKLYDLSRLGDELCITMEYVDGLALHTILKGLARAGVRLPPPIAIKLVLDACDALHYAHTATRPDGSELKVVHRDISPSNLMLDGNGYLKVIDFGIAKTTIQTELTTPGGFKGKLSYMPPEALLSGDVDHRADIYSLGLVLFEALAMKRARRFQDLPVPQVVELIDKMELRFADEVRAVLGRGLEEVIQKATAAKVEDRFQSCEKFARALRRAAGGPDGSSLGGEGPGVASAHEVKTWFTQTFAKHLAARRKMEREALERAELERRRTESSARLGMADIDALGTMRLDVLDGGADDAARTPTSTATSATAATMAQSVAKPKNPYLFLAFFFLLFVVGAGVVHQLFFAQDAPDVAAGAENILVVSDPAEAQVFVDGAEVGNTGQEGLALRLQPGLTRSIKVVKPGFLSVETKVEPGETGRERVAVKLMADDDPDALPSGDFAGAAGRSSAGGGSGAQAATEPAPSSKTPKGKTKRSPPERRRSKVANARPVTSKTKSPQVPAAAKSAASTKSDEDKSKAKSTETASKSGPTPSKGAESQAAAPKETAATREPTPKPKPAKVAKVDDTKPKPKPKAPPAAASAPKKPTKKWISKAGNWKGSTVWRRGCARCHNSKTAAKLDIKSMTARQWDRFFRRKRHNKHGSLDVYFSPSEQRAVRAYVSAKLGSKKRGGVAGVR